MAKYIELSKSIKDKHLFKIKNFLMPMLKNFHTLELNAQIELCDCVNFLRDDIYRWNLLHFPHYSNCIKYINFTKSHFEIDILHRNIEKYFETISDINYFIDFLYELKCLDNFFDCGLLEKQIFHLNVENQTFIQRLYHLKENKVECFLFLLKILPHIVENSHSYEKLVYSKDVYGHTIISNISSDSVCEKFASYLKSEISFKRLIISFEKYRQNNGPEQEINFFCLKSKKLS